jgi:hypothetical protein
MNLAKHTAWFVTLMSLRRVFGLVKLSSIRLATLVDILVISSLIRSIRILRIILSFWLLMFFLFHLFTISLKFRILSLPRMFFFSFDPLLALLFFFLSLLLLLSFTSLSLSSSFFQLLWLRIFFSSLMSVVLLVEFGAFLFSVHWLSWIVESLLLLSIRPCSTLILVLCEIIIMLSPLRCPWGQRVLAGKPIKFVFAS